MPSVNNAGPFLSSRPSAASAAFGLSPGGAIKRGNELPRAGLSYLRWVCELVCELFAAESCTPSRLTAARGDLSQSLHTSLRSLLTRSLLVLFR